jgi:uncharacterized protein YbcV (DUF1398 family)
METDQKTVIHDCAARSAAGTISFGEVVGRLMEAGVERYHADYCRRENTFYLPSGSSLVVAMTYGDEASSDAAPPAIAAAFSAREVEAAIRQAQRGEIMYPEFVKLTTAAGCIGYFVQISGRCVQYFGRNGEMHVEPFPGGR